MTLTVQCVPRRERLDEVVGETRALLHRGAARRTCASPIPSRPTQNPSGVRAIFHDGQSTFIRLEAPQLPAVYELKDDAASLLNLQAQDGLLIVPR
jgi:hypothetical protein